MLYLDFAKAFDTVPRGTGGGGGGGGYTELD